MTKLPELPLRRAFLGNTLEKLVSLINQQGEEILKDAGVYFPPRAATMMLLLMKNGPMSAADLAKALKQPHQLVTQRIEALIGCKVISRASDSTDLRRKLLRITPAGKLQLRRLKDRLDRIEAAYAGLFDEVDCDLADVALRTVELLLKRTLGDRVRSTESTTRPKAAR